MSTAADDAVASSRGQDASYDPGSPSSLLVHGNHGMRVHAYEPAPCHGRHKLAVRPSHQPHGDGYWLIFIHGGAWRDPRNTYADFYPAVDKILAAPYIDADIAVAGFASIDYRLSPSSSASLASPDGPSLQAADPAAEDHTHSAPQWSSNKARHPDHIKDIWLALAYLQRTYGFGGRYVLIGHSAGATLAMQLLMGSAATFGGNGGSSGGNASSFDVHDLFHRGLPCENLTATEPAFQHHSRHHKTLVPGRPPLDDVEPPAAVLGVAGIYEFADFNERFGGAYAGFLGAAFGDDPTRWDEAAPARFRGNFKTAFPGTRLVVLAWSPEDGLVDEPEIDGMAGVLKADGVRCCVVKDVKGDHDFAWRDGEPIARLVARVLAELKKIDGE